MSKSFKAIVVSVMFIFILLLSLFAYQSIMRITQVEEYPNVVNTPNGNEISNNEHTNDNSWSQDESDENEVEQNNIVEDDDKKIISGNNGRLGSNVITTYPTPYVRSYATRSYATPYFYGDASTYASPDRINLSEKDLEQYLDDYAAYNYQYKVNYNYINDFKLKKYEPCSSSIGTGMIYEVNYNYRGNSKFEYYFVGVKYQSLSNGMIQIVDVEDDSDDDLHDIYEEAYDEGFRCGA